MVPVAVTAAALGACMQTASVPDKSALRTAHQQALPEMTQEAPVVRRRVAIKAIKHTPYKRTAAMPVTSFGVASFYTEEQQTANGEKFNPNELTAAHPTLPFGTRLRVTNVATGRSVTVRINDRGPYVPGRVVDVSYSAAETLGIVDRGVAKVKLDVIH
ncbi:MAG TPA: septal ring lytic transglycosylase RlpA family protein [Pseudolabrys sp.]|nr:septal ring lytic transglycosylase RlpA family protein [Pseudolabrys sp.]